MTHPSGPAVVPGSPLAPVPAPVTARAGARDLARLLWRLGTRRMRAGAAFDAGAVTCEWARALMQPDGARALEVTVGGKGIQLVGDREYSQHVLGDFPSSRGYAAGVPKVSAMRFLAPHALTIADGEAWVLLRPFNERVLGTGGFHPCAQAILDRVNTAFSRPVPDVAGLRAAMGRAMVGIVLGDATPGGAQAAEDVRDLFGVVQNPVKRKLLGWRYRSRHRRLYEVLGRAWDAATPADQTLIARARYGAPAGDRTTMLEQVPHWMFTFTGSGTDLLARTLVLVTSRPAILRRVVDEVHAAGPLEQPGPVERLPLVEACLLETGRLFPPVTRTFHSHPARPGTPTLAHWFPLLQRDDRLAQGVHEFTPDRWLGPELDAAAAASNLFLRGPRACPGMDLILFVSKVALARLVAGFGITAPHARLASDPLPVSFPGIPSRFNVPEVAP